MVSKTFLFLLLFLIIKLNFTFTIFLADNILVWKFPRSNQMTSHINSNLNAQSTENNSTNNVFLKLADYSISRMTLPTGTKGFAGTPGFMAPEILKFNGLHILLHILPINLKILA